MYAKILMYCYKRLVFEIEFKIAMLYILYMFKP